MRLLKCHIENFGKLKSFDYSFEAGLNKLVSHNGWGKSTLATFIRVMFYGFEGEGKRKGLENERKRYEPWQGGVYGGSITFTDGTKTYVATRTFGAKAAVDTFELRDADTNLISDDYSDRLGEELFAVNSESFARTVYIGQNDVVTHTTDVINAKIGNTSDSGDDLDVYERAMENIAGLLNRKSMTRSTGELYRLNGEVTEYQMIVRAGAGIADSREQLNNQLDSKKNILELKCVERDSIVQSQSKVSAYKDMLAKRKVYDKLCDDLKLCDEDIKTKRAAFTGEVPTRENIECYSKMATELTSEVNMLESYRLTASEADLYESFSERFAGEIPDVTKVTSVSEKWHNREPVLRSVSSKGADLTVLKSNLEAEKKTAGRMPGASYVGILLVVIALALAVTAVTLLGSSTSIAAAFAGCGVLMIVGTVMIVVSMKKRKQRYGCSIGKQELEISALQEEIDSDSRYADELEHAVKEFVESCGVTYNSDTVSDALLKIMKEVSEFEHIDKKMRRYEETNKSVEDKKKRVDDYLISIGTVPGDDYNAVFAGLLIKLNSLEEADKRRESALAELHRYEADNDMEAINAFVIDDELPDLAGLSEEYERVGRDIAAISQEIREIEISLNALDEKYNEWEEARMHLGELEQRLVDSSKNYKLLQVAGKYLTEAKESLTARYMGPLLNSFNKYYTMISDDGYEYRIDANMNITVDEAGKQRDTENMSTGYRDMIGFCMRLSLVDAMYKADKPMIVLDDPFVNLDDDKRPKALAFLDKLAEEYQVIYFSCHRGL